MAVPRLLPLLGLAVAPALAAQDTTHVVVVATTDLHGRAYHWDYVHDREAPWGLTRVATVLDSLRRQYADRVVLVDAGDITQGNPFATYFATVRPAAVHPVIDAMNALRYDGAAPGNHEFNFGVDVWERAAAGATFPILAGNVFRVSDGERPWPAAAIVLRTPLRIGIAGFTTPGAMIWDREHLRGRLRVAPILPEAERALQRMGEQGLDLRIVTLHSGMDGPSSYDTTGVGPENVAAELARLPVPPHLVVVGHSHGMLADSVIAGVHFIQARPWAQSVAVAHVWLVREQRRQGGRAAGVQAAYRVVRIHGEQVPLADVRPSVQLTHRLEPHHQAVREWVAAPLTRTEGNWSGRYARAQDTPLIDFINGVQRRVTGADLSATAAFNVQAGFGPQVRLRDVAGVYPYENTLKAVRIDGARLKAYLERSSAYFRSYGAGGAVLNDSIPGYNYDIVSGVSYALDLREPVGSRVRQLTFRGRPVADTDTFTLALNNYRQGGGGGFDMLAGLPVVYDRGENVRDLLAEALRGMPVLRADDWFEDSWRLIPDAARELVRLEFAPTVGPATDTVVLRVVSTNDLHGALETGTPDFAEGRRVGGAAVLKAWMDSLEARCRCPMLRVDAGDQWQGTPISSWGHGRATVEATNRMGYHAAAIGNHEFDWGIDTLRARLGQSAYPFLSANIRLREGGGVPPWARPWTMITIRGTRIGVIGITLEGTSTSANPDLVRSLRFETPAQAVQRVLPEVRAQQPDFVVVVAHEGAFCDSVCTGNVIELARALPTGAVDLIVSGHTHSRLNTVVNAIPIIQAFSRGTSLGVVDFVRRADGSRLVRGDVLTAWADSVRPDTAVAAVVARFAAETARRANQPIARLRFALPREDDGEYALGQLIADAYRNVGRAEVALINNSGIRAGLPGGAVSYGQLFEVQPFANGVVTLTVTGAVLLEALEHALSGERPAAHVSGITVRWDPRRPAGARVREVRFPDGRTVRRDGRYTLAVPDFLAAGGSRYAMLRDKPTAAAGVNDLDALVQYLRRLPEPVEVAGGNRFIAER